MIDSSQLKELSAVIAREGPAVMKKVPEVVAKSTERVKARMRKDARASTHFAPLARSIDDDLIIGADKVEGRVEPDRNRNRSASLAGLAYFGASRGGGGTVPDPVLALDEEEPRFMQGMAELAGFEF